MVATKALEELKKNPWDEGSEKMFTEIAERNKFSDKGRLLQKLQQEAIPLYNAFKKGGPENFLSHLLSNKYSTYDAERFLSSYHFELFIKKLTPEEKNQIRFAIEEQILKRNNEIEDLTTDPGWLWGRREKAEPQSSDTKKRISTIKKELIILKAAEKIFWVIR